ncbi:sensor histidine kinase [Thermodesulfobium narugense]|uniref:sensor histidine kinase n=1 Tax=Thermodesulfobium narugense TaxID=184064 RepID=UPI00145E4581|nr:HAMP domain-containing sensor histidine kinase [Thermodesulfobium narugense]
MKDVIELIEYPVLIIGKNGQIVCFNKKFKEFSWIKDLEGKYYFEVLRFSEAHEILKDYKIKDFEKEILLGMNLTKYTFIVKSSQDLRIIALRPEENKEESELKKKLLGQISHELKTPISAISSIIEIGEATGKIDSTFSEKVLGKIKRLDLALNNAIVITKIQLGLINIKKTKINILSFLEEVLKNSLSDESYLNVEKDIKEDENVETDPYILKTIVKNIFLNSIIHGKEPIFVSFNEKILVIRDSGPGFKEGEIRELNRQEGSGIGLGTAIIKSLAKMAGIHTYFSNEKGAKVELRF